MRAENVRANVENKVSNRRHMETSQSNITAAYLYATSH
jgi:hypothetical protein